MHMSNLLPMGSSFEFIILVIIHNTENVWFHEYLAYEQLWAWNPGAIGSFIADFSDFSGTGNSC